jgi:hypothetical protein
VQSVPVPACVIHIPVFRFSAALRRVKVSLPEDQYAAVLCKLLKMVDFVAEWRDTHPSGASRFGDQNVVRLLASSSSRTLRAC